MRQDSFVICYSDGTERDVPYDDLKLDGGLDVKHWLCDAGDSSLYIDNYGNAYPCESFYFDKMPPSFSIYSFSTADLHMSKRLCSRSGCYNYHIHKRKVFHANSSKRQK